MATCDRCGNEYDKTFQVIAAGGETRTFDSFECAIAELAPRCETCDTPIIGHGVESDEGIFCCDHCAEAAGVEGLRDRI